MVAMATESKRRGALAGVAAPGAVRGGIERRARLEERDAERARERRRRFAVSYTAGVVALLGVSWLAQSFELSETSALALSVLAGLGVTFALRPRRQAEGSEVGG